MIDEDTVPNGREKQNGGNAVVQRTEKRHSAVDAAFHLASNLDRYRHADPERLRRYLVEAAATNRLAVAWEPSEDGRTVIGFALWATVPDDVDRTLRHTSDPANAPLSLRPTDWAGGSNLWLLDILASTLGAGSSVLKAFRQIAETRAFNVHPAAAVSVVPGSLERLMGLASSDGSTATSKRASARAKGTPVAIDTERLVLASLSSDDAPVLCKWMADPRVTVGLLQTARIVDLDQAQSFIAAFDDHVAYLLGIRSKDGRLLGFLMAHIDAHQRSATVSIVLGERGSLRRHVGEEAVRALMDWLFTVRGVEKIIMQVAASNRVVIDWISPIIRLEARLIKELRGLDGARVDMLRFGTLREEWPDVKAASIERTIGRHP